MKPIGINGSWNLLTSVKRSPMQQMKPIDMKDGRDLSISAKRSTCNRYSELISIVVMIHSSVQKDMQKNAANWVQWWWGPKTHLQKDHHTAKFTQCSKLKKFTQQMYSANSLGKFTQWIYSVQYSATLWIYNANLLTNIISKFTWWIYSANLLSEFA